MGVRRHPDGAEEGESKSALMRETSCGGRGGADGADGGGGGGERPGGLNGTGAGAAEV